MIRGRPAIVWYGFQTWLGGSAINQISIAIFGYDNVVLFFLLFQVVQIILSVKGFHGIKWVENIGGVVIVSAMLYMLFVCVTQYWGVIGDKLISRKGSWGMPFIAGVFAFFGNSTTGMLKAVVDAKTGTILGCALHCADAGEMINVVETAIRAGKGYTFLRDMIYTHPSMTEALNDLLSKIK